VTARSLLDETQAAKYIGMSVAYLRADRYRGHVGHHTPGPAYFKLGVRVKYDAADLDAWLSARRVDRSERRPAA
jgi:hypothetical protein